MSRAPRFWFSQNPIAWLLLPLTALFCLLVASRRLLYRWRLLDSHAVAVPVIVIGNIAVGGTGKTPFLIELAKRLRARGLHPAIVSRGYGSGIEGPHLVAVDDTAEQIGDEPRLIADKTGCPLVIARQRSLAARLLAERRDVDLVLSDDGLQHYAMQRDLEIAVVDAGWQHGNGFCLPSGPLREPVSRLKTVNHVIYKQPGDPSLPGFRLQPAQCRNLVSGETRELAGFSDTGVHAVAGIGQPTGFFSSLEEAGLRITAHPFGDHHAYTETDLAFSGTDPILMTEKDAVKCRLFATDRMWVLETDIELDELLAARIIDDIVALCRRGDKLV